VKLTLFRVMPAGQSCCWTVRVRTAPLKCALRKQPGGSMTAETPVLDTLADITAVSVEHNSLAPRELMLARIAALIAVDAPPVSYLANAGAATDSGVTAEDIQAIMIGIAPVVGTPRVVAAGGNILRALGFEITVAENAGAGQ
jgi:alkylhydroperoxidase/carboxymuconolactone decarboxylase family protein YurZ